ncbi:hypothetical protein HMPREF1092_02916 [Clostridium thermobutyricum]|uniref:DUF11 domain-containing protein n=1 Tax=Clostridium thermobutyricum TaxID=29372 RepID=N9W9S7_9CLOT|nr:DUF11 domain-containing protein [Clostridium thermobutyricum]ENY99780.1 hypothetical protein HMPREF1092_02916 [Clostridium thermobutyricum]
MEKNSLIEIPKKSLSEEIKDNAKELDSLKSINNKVTEDSPELLDVGLTSVISTFNISSPVTDPNPLNNTVVSTVAITLTADLALTMTDSPDPVHPGEILIYTINIKNNGPSDSVGVILTDTLPLTVTLPSYSLDNGVTWNTWLGTLPLGTITNGSTKTVLIRGTVAATATGTISNTASVTSTTLDPNLSNNSATTTTTVSPLADLSIVKTANPSPVHAGAQLIYTLVITNNGPSTATNIIVTDNVPACFSTPEYSTNAGLTWNPWTSSVNIGSLASGLSSTVLLRGTVCTNGTSSITNTATVSSDTDDPNLSNNTSTTTTNITPVSDLAITKQANPEPVAVGSQLTYTLVITNNGPSTANGIVLTDNIPNTVTNPQYSLDNGTTWTNWTGTLNLNPLNNGASEKVLIRGTVSNTAIGIITNTASVTSNSFDPNLSNNSATVISTISLLADLAITVSASPDPVMIGETLVYTVNAVNNGPSTATPVTLTYTAPLNLSNIEYSLDNGATWQTLNLVANVGTINLGTLANGANKTILIRGIVLA